MNEEQKKLITYGYHEGWDSCRDAMIKKFNLNKTEVMEWDKKDE